MDKQTLDSLKQHFAYDSWFNRNTLDENLFIWQFSLDSIKIPGWRAEHIQNVELPEFVPFIQSIWQSADNEPGVLLRIDAYKCESRLRAGEFLLEFLATFQSPLIQRRENLPVGDVVFATEEDTGIIFARANLVFFITNADQILVPVFEIARFLDEILTSKPEITAVEIVPEIPNISFASEGEEIRASIPLAAETLLSSTQGSWYKLFSASGEIYEQFGQLIYRPVSSAAQEVKVFPFLPE